MHVKGAYACWCTHFSVKDKNHQIQLQHIKPIVMLYFYCCVVYLVVAV